MSSDEERMEEKLRELLKIFDEGKVLQNALGISDADMEERYTNGYHLFEKGEYDDAEQVFYDLTALNPSIKSYWMALAVSQIRGSGREQALTSLAMASIIDPDDPEPHYYSALCYVSFDKRPEAAQAMRLTLALSRESGLHKHLEDEALTWLSQLK